MMKGMSLTMPDDVLSPYLPSDSKAKGVVFHQFFCVLKDLAALKYPTREPGVAMAFFLALHVFRIDRASDVRRVSRRLSDAAERDVGPDSAIGLHSGTSSMKLAPLSSTGATISSSSPGGFSDPNAYPGISDHPGFPSPFREYTSPTSQPPEHQTMKGIAFNKSAHPPSKTEAFAVEGEEAATKVSPRKSEALSQNSNPQKPFSPSTLSPSKSNVPSPSSFTKQRNSDLVEEEKPRAPSPSLAPTESHLSARKLPVQVQPLYTILVFFLPIILAILYTFFRKNFEKEVGETEGGSLGLS